MTDWRTTLEDLAHTRSPALVGYAFLRRTIRNAFIDDYRRRTRWSAIRHLFVSGDSPAPDQTDATDDRLTVTEALDILTPRERACIVLRYYEDLTLAQIADELNLATGSVKRYLSDANRKLGLTFELSDDGLDSRPADAREPLPDIGPEETIPDGTVPLQPGRST